MTEMHHPVSANTTHKGRSGMLLLVDDEPDNLDLLEGMLARSNYKTERAENGKIALGLLRESPDRFDAVLLDRMMPEMDGITVLQNMKADDRLKHIPVILQTAAGNTMQVSEGLAAGAHYYLIKPFDRGQLLPIINGAVATYQLMREMRSRLVESNPFGLIMSGRFRYHTIAEARELATWLAKSSGDPAPVAFGLQELLINAVEHGSLELGYERKRDAIKNNTLDDELARRAQNDVFAKRAVWVDVERDDSSVLFTIRDEGPGFDYSRFAEVDPARMVDPNGRGIMIARDLSFDELTYLDGGRTVCARAALSSWQDA